MSSIPPLRMGPRAWLRLAALALASCSPLIPTSTCTVAAPTGTALTTGFNPCFTQTIPDTPNSIGVTISGETLAESGLPFCPLNQGDPYFVDGWSVAFDNYIVVIANIRLNSDPLQSSTWQDMGPQVAIKPGPFVVDLHNTETGGFVGKDGVEPAAGMFMWTQQDNGQPFDSSQRYAFSYDIVEATYPVTNVNLKEGEFAIYDQMVKNKWSKYVNGTAQFAGSGTYDDPTNPYNARAMANFATLPTSTRFSFGWDDHTSALNCVNADLGAEDDLNNRGIQTNPNEMYIAQVTIHTDHLFWDTLQHEGEPLRFDTIAAWVNSVDAGGNLLTSIFDLSGELNDQRVATVFPDGTPIPDRGPYEPDSCPNAGGTFTTDMGNGHQVVMNTAGVTTVNPQDYRTFMMFSVQSQAHLNAQGLCYIVGQHPSDPYFTPVVNPEVP